MPFRLFGKKKEPPKPVDPLEAFDAMITALERQGVEVRKSAATLLALKGELARDREKFQKRLASIDERRVKAANEPRVLRTLEGDHGETQRMLARTDEALAQAESDAKLLLETAERLKSELLELREERQSAKARLSAGVMVSEALKARVASFDKVMKLDAARDEVERAHALADLYRDEVKAP